MSDDYRSMLIITCYTFLKIHGTLKGMEIQRHTIENHYNNNGKNQGSNISYCWWKESCTTWDVKIPVNNGDKTTNLIWLAGFLNHQK